MITKTCRSCSRQFSYEPIIFCGKEIFPSRPCDECMDKGAAERDAREKEIRNAEIARAWNQMIPPLYQESDPSRLPSVALQKVLEWKFGPKGIILHGPTGTGKTRAAVMLLRRIHFQDGKKIAAFFGNSFAHQCGQLFLRGGGEDWISQLAKVDLLFLDDFGKNKFTDRVEAEQFGLIEHRISHLRPVVITTNFVGKTLSEKMSDDRSEPMIRRLREFCDDVAFQL